VKLGIGIASLAPDHTHCFTWSYPNTDTNHLNGSLQIYRWHPSFSTNQTRNSSEGPVPIGAPSHPIHGNFTSHPTKSSAAAWEGRGDGERDAGLLRDLQRRQTEGERMWGGKWGATASANNDGAVLWRPSDLGGGGLPWGPWTPWGREEPKGDDRRTEQNCRRGFRFCTVWLHLSFQNCRRGFSFCTVWLHLSFLHRWFF
jgi:hypothetical protein